MQSLDRYKQAILKDHAMQYYCHVQFVVEIALRLGKVLGGDLETLEIAALLHDIGRGRENKGETHYNAGARIAGPLIDCIETNKKEKILRCIQNHSAKEKTIFIEEDIIITADAGSKIEFHEAFMLMCKKEAYTDKLKWGIKHLKKNFQKITIDSYRNSIAKKYAEILEMYEKASKGLQSS